MIGDDGDGFPCPGCGLKLDGQVPTNCAAARGPQAGAVSLCIHCSTLGVFTSVAGRLALRQATDAELDAMLRDPDVQRAIAAVRALRERAR